MKASVPKYNFTNPIITKMGPHDLIREDGERIERVCKHGVGHPIGSVGQWEDWMGVHGCDGCCRDAEFWLDWKDENV